MPMKIGNLEIHLGPQEVGGPDDLRQEIISFIGKAKKTLYVAVQEIDNTPIAQAVTAAKQRGVKTVQVVLEQDYLRSGKIHQTPFQSGGRHESNRILHAAMLRTDVDVKADFNPAIFHQKFIVRDGSAVLTGSTNFTDTGVGKNLNHVIILKDKKVANAYTKEFREIRQGRFGKRSMDRDEKPIETKISGIRIKPLFAPDHAPEMEIIKQILKAQTRIDFAVFTFAQSSGIDDVLKNAAARGIQINGVLDKRQANQSWAATHHLRVPGVSLCVAGNRGALGKVHHKLMVIDDQLVIGGSFNYTGPANLTNDENIVVIGDLEETQAAIRRKQRRLGQFVRAEIDRICADFGEVIN